VKIFLFVVRNENLLSLRFPDYTDSNFYIYLIKKESEESEYVDQASS